MSGKNQRLLARVSYDGMAYRGFQLQPGNAKTVQGELEAVLSKRFGKGIYVVGASRTDTGVHARGQAVHFDLPSKAAGDMGRLEYACNQMLPEDIRMWNLTVAPAPSPERLAMGLPFHANVDASSKLYSYRIFIGPVVCPLDQLFRAHVPGPIDLGLLDDALQQFRGTHNFAAFANQLD
ncbi:unnamed protein product, partial [Phaeothamnion confervicola]